MTPPPALITGIAGQDGSYLAEHLLGQGYEVHGTVRRNSTPEHQESRISHLSDSVTTHYADVLDSTSLLNLLREIQPLEIYNLAAQSHVRISFEVPSYTLEANACGPLNLFEAVRQLGLSCKIYQASSSEMFGTHVDPDGFQRETTNMLPASPYGAAKLAAYHLGRCYRDGYGIFISNGILFNHESPRRGSNFVTTKVVAGAARIALGLQDRLELGNLDARRDWGHSRDYVRAMHLMLQHPEPDDFVVATGETHSVRDLCKFAFGYFGLKYDDFVDINPRFFRPKEVPHLRGDPTKAKEKLGWQSTISFESLVHEMASAWADSLTRNRLDTE